MLILAPPSEGKAAGSRGRPLDLDQLSFPELTETRVEVVDALVDLSARAGALDVLGVGAGVRDQVDRNVDLWSAPTLPASRLYTGVLYDALDLASLDRSGKARAARRLVVISAAFGALRPNDKVPSYRLSMDVALPGVGKLAAAWRPSLDAVLPAVVGRGLVVDLRSSTYAAAWRPEGALAERTVAVHVLREQPDGTRSVVSHMAKHTRGIVARWLLETGVDPRTPEALADALAADFRVELDGPREGKTRRLEIVEAA
ncbi:MAG: peroxide stress protein YaaA [Acidimicrobiales bacterium]|nr:peroxide stress protein YaaA [Acidimicrobiales bacterium]